MSEVLPAAPGADTFLNLIRDGERAHDARLPLYDHAYEVYRAQAPKGVKKQPYESQLRIPYGLSMIDTALVNIVGGQPKARVKPRRPQDTDSAPKMETVLDYHVHEDHLAEKWPLFVWQGLVYPLTAAKNHWMYRETERPTRHHVPHPDGSGRVIELETRERVVLRDGPTFEPWDIYDIWWEPMARDVDSAAYIVLRSWPSKEELLNQARSERNPFGLYDLAQLEELFQQAPQQAGRQLSALERYKRGTSDKRKGRYELLEIWRDDMLVVIADRRILLRAEPNPYWHGRKPVVIAQTRVDGFEMTGIGETELLDHIQQALHANHNARQDNLNMTVHRGFTYRETGILDPRALVVKPRFFWPVTDHDDIKPVDMPTLSAEVYREDDVLLSRMQFVTGINPYVSGAETTGVDQNTATGVTALTELASRLLRFKARMLTYKGLQRTFEQWGEMIQQFMDKPTSVRIEGAGAIDWDEVSPQEIAGNYDYTVEGTEESLSQQQERGESVNLLNALAPFANAGFINWQPLLEKVARAYNFDSPKVLFRQQPQLQEAAPAGAANGGSPEQPTAPPMTLDQSALHPQISGAILRGR